MLSLSSICKYDRPLGCNLGTKRAFHGSFENYSFF